MKIFTLILFVISLQISILKANGFYAGVSAGANINGDTTINIKNINQQKSFVETPIINKADETYYSGAWKSTRVITDTTTDTTYNAILKEISYAKTDIAPIVAFNGGYSFKNLRFEAEVKAISMKIKPKHSIYDITMQQHYYGVVKSYCTKNNNNGSCNNQDGFDINFGNPNNSNDPEAKYCPTISGVNSTTCLLNINAIDEINNFDFNNVSINTDSSMFSNEVNAELFSNITDITSNNVLGFMNFLYELGVSKNIVAFAGLGAGYGMAMISSDLTSKQNITYPAYQVKLGAYYALSSSVDITLNYSNISMIGKANKGNLELSNNNLQAVEFGIRYNFFNRPTSFAEDYNYRTIFRLP